MSGQTLNVSLEDWTSNVTNSSPPIPTESLSLFVTIILSLVCVFIITSNSLLVYCIQTNRKKTWAKQTRQIFYLIVSDLVAGVFLIPAIVIIVLNASRKAYILCAVVSSTGLSSQVISYYHMLAVCIHRYRMVKKLHLPSRNDRYRYDVESGVIWATVLLAFLPPYIVWGRKDDALGKCRLDFLFGPSDRPAFIYILVLYCLPWVLTNVMYVVILCHLRMRLRAVQPGGTYTVRYRNKASSSRSPNHEPCNTALTPISLTIQESAPVEVSTYNRARANKVVKAVGYLLLVLNISMLSPVITFSMMLSGNTNSLHGALLSLAYLNNISNPFIYSLSITPLREEMKTIIRAMLSRLQTVVMPIITPW